MLGQYAKEKRLRVAEALPVPGATPLYVTQVADTLYVPELNLQVVGECVVPAEAIDPWSLDFERTRDFQGRTATYRVPFNVDYVEKDVCILANLYSRNFYHWITEELIRVVVLESMGYCGDYVVEGLPGFATVFMHLLGIAGARVIESVAQPTIFKSATFVTPVTEEKAILHRELYMSLRDLILAVADASKQNFSRRIWMVRGIGAENGRRNISNADEVNSVLGRHGFDSVDMASLSLPTQIAVSRDAEILAGPHGAAFVHTLFMRPKSRVIECFSPFFINPGIFNLCRIMKHRYSMLVHANAYGVYTEEDELRIDCSQLELALQGWE